MNAVNQAHGGRPVRAQYDGPIITADTVARAQRAAQYGSEAADLLAIRDREEALHKARRSSLECPPGYRVEVRTGRMCLFRAVRVADGAAVGTWATSRRAALAQIAFGVMA